MKLLGSTLTLVICLAAAASQVGAGVLTMTVTLVEFNAFADGVESVSINSAPGFLPFVPSGDAQGVKLFGAAQSTRTGSCGETECQEFRLTYSASGGFAGDTSARDLIIPIEWAFTAGAGNPATSFDYSLHWRVADNQGGTVVSSQIRSGTETGLAFVSGSGGLHTFSRPGSGDQLSSWSLDVSIYGNFAAGTTLTLDIPNSSVDINRPVNTGGEVPEPSGFVLLLGGTGLLLAMRARRRQRALAAGKE